jgi:TPP-dependent 2-oxoacid decarboxylase
VTRTDVCDIHDYQLRFLDCILEEDGLEWRGNANELIAAYDADGYARVNGAGVLVTTFGPGELSALCGIGGSYAESVPVVHIVGYPNVEAQQNHAVVHHSLGEGDFLSLTRKDRYIASYSLFPSMYGF